MLLNWGDESLDAVAYHISYTMSCDRRLFHETFYTNVEGRLIFGHETIIEARVAGFDCLKNAPEDEPCKAQKFQEYLASLEQADCRDLSNWLSFHVR